MQRRRYLTLVGLGATTALAGCLGGSEDTTDDQTGEPAADDESNGTADLPGEELGDEPLAPGEGVVFFTEDGSEELSFRPLEPTATTHLATDRPDQGLVASEFPDNDWYLLVPVQLENMSEQALDVPSDVELAVEGATYAHTLTAYDEQYEEFQELPPGEQSLQVLVFDMPATESEAILSTAWGRLERVEAEWALDLEGVPVDGLDHRGLAVGEEFGIGTSDIQYTLVVEAVDKRAGEHSADDIVSVTFTVENTGSLPALDPTIRGAWLEAAGAEYEAAAGRRELLEAEELAPGERETVTLEFSIPAEEGTVSDEDHESSGTLLFQVQITHDMIVSWEL